MRMYGITVQCTYGSDVFQLFFLFPTFIVTTLSEPSPYKIKNIKNDLKARLLNITTFFLFMTETYATKRVFK